MRNFTACWTGFFGLNLMIQGLLKSVATLLQSGQFAPYVWDERWRWIDQKQKSITKHCHHRIPLPERSANVNSLDFYAVGRLLGKGAFGKAGAFGFQLVQVKSFVLCRRDQSCLSWKVNVAVHKLTEEKRFRCFSYSDIISHSWRHLCNLMEDIYFMFMYNVYQFIIQNKYTIHNIFRIYYLFDIPYHILILQWSKGARDPVQQINITKHQELSAMKQCDRRRMTEVCWPCWWISENMATTGDLPKLWDVKMWCDFLLWLPLKAGSKKCFLQEAELTFWPKANSVLWTLFEFWYFRCICNL